jgi:hypothetical protein
MRRDRLGGRVAVGALVLTAALVLAACEPMSADELRREVDTVHSTAAEASVLGDQIASQNTKRTFARVQARELADAAQHSAERLTDAHPADGLEAQLQRAIALAEDVSDAAGSLEVAPDDAVAAGHAADRLRELARQTDELAASI